MTMESPSPYEESKVTKESSQAARPHLNRAGALKPPGTHIGTAIKMSGWKIRFRSRVDYFQGPSYKPNTNTHQPLKDI